MRLVPLAVVLALAAAPSTAQAGGIEVLGWDPTEWEPSSCHTDDGATECQINDIPLESPDPKGDLRDTTTTVSAKASAVMAVASATLAQSTARALTQTGAGQILPSETLARMNISVECTAEATPNPLAVGIEQCYLLGDDGSRYSALDDGAMPGAADATVHAVLSAPTQSYRVCVQSQAFFQDNILLEAPTVCSS